MLSDKEKALKTMAAIIQMMNNHAGGAPRNEMDKVEHVVDYIMRSNETPGEWHPISEKWPAVNGNYLTTTIHGNVFCDHWSEDHFDRIEVVLAWMELPEPYRWEDKNNAE